MEENKKNEIEESEEQKTTSEDMDESTVKVLCILGYFWILFLIPLLVCPKSNKFARFHTNQAILLFIASTVLGAISGLLGLIPYVGWIFGTLVGVLTLVLLVLQIVAVAENQERELPIIGKIRILK